ncbi:MAG TPA: AI-2E family transporter, partial [Chloroflexota bacterium]|nr:AI-2E family transporter [Chloroflexota bacterium]
MAFSLSGSAADRWQRAFYVPLTILAWLAVLLVIGWLLGHLVRTLVMIVLGVVIAFALTPLVRFLGRWLKRPYAIAGAYFLALAVVVGLGILLVVTAAGQVVTLVANLPTYFLKAQQITPQVSTVLAPFGVTEATFQAANQQLLAALQQLGESLAAGSVGILQGIVGVVLDTALTLMLSIYFTANGPRIGAWLVHSAPPTLRPWTRPLVSNVNQVVGGYIRGTLTMATLIGVLVGGGLLVLGVPYAVLLGVLAFFMEFVPVIGTLISGVVSIAVALASGPTLALAVLGYFVVVHLIEGDIVGPRVHGRAVGR